MDNIRALTDLVRSSTLSRLSKAGVLEPKRLTAGIAALPWVIGRGASLGTLCQIHARSRPDRRAIVDRSGELTWRELDDRVNRVARAIAELGVEPGDQVAVLLRNGREWVETVLACQKTGVVAAPMNTWGKKRELGNLLERDQPSVLIYDTRQADQLEGVVPGVTNLIHVGRDSDALEGSVAYEELLADQPRKPPSPVARDRGSTRILIHTSGTTGTPKAAARDTGGSAAITLLGVLDAVPYRHDDVMYVPNPLFHAFGVLTFALGMITGATFVLPDQFDPRQALEDLDRHGITAASFVPVMLNRMLDLDDPPDIDAADLRLILVSGSALPPRVRDRARERFGDVLYDLYGSTEAGWVAVAGPDAMREAPDSVGKPVPGVEVAILDEDGEPVADGNGLISIRSTATFEGYASGEETEQNAGYLSTGDLGHFDENGYLHVAGRADDMVVVGGENVYPDEIEDVIDAIDGVREVAVLGVPDEDMGEVLAAFVVGDADEDTIVGTCRDQLPSYKVPKHVRFVDELPRTSTGKVLRRDLKERIEA